MRVKLAPAFDGGDCESVTVTAILKIPAVVGMPAIEPLVSVSPGGRTEPDVEAQFQEYGATPPDAVRRTPLADGPYTVWTVPDGRVVVVTMSACGRSDGGVMAELPPPQPASSQIENNQMESDASVLAVFFTRRLSSFVQDAVHFEIDGDACEFIQNVFAENSSIFWPNNRDSAC